MVNKLMALSAWLHRIASKAYIMRHFVADVPSSVLSVCVNVCWSQQLAKQLSCWADRDNVWGVVRGLAQLNHVCMYIYIYISGQVGSRPQPPGRGTIGAHVRWHSQTWRQSTNSTYLAFFCKAAAVMRPLATSTVATCYSYVLISLNVHFEQTVYDLRMTAA